MKDRSVIEIMVLVFTTVVGAIIFLLSGTVVYVEVSNPDADTGIIANTLMSLISAILGALLGLIAGRSITASLDKRPDGTDDGVLKDDREEDE